MTKATTVAPAGRRGGVLSAMLYAVALVGLLAGPAGAEVALVRTDPGIGATLTDQVDAVVLWFDGPVAAAEVRVAGPGGEPVDEGDAAVHGDRVVQSLGPVRPQGTYSVTFRAVAEDEQAVEGTYTFTYEGPVGTGGQTDPPPASEDTDVMSPGEDTAELREPSGVGSEDARNPEESRDVDLGVPLLVLTVVALGGCVVGAVVMVRRRGAPRKVRAREYDDR